MNLTRSRPFSVIDMNAFAKDIEDINRLFSQSDDGEVVPPRVLFGHLPQMDAVYIYTTEPGWPNAMDNGLDEDLMDFDFFDRISQHLADGQVAVLEEITVDSSSMIEGDTIPSIDYRIHVLTNEGLQDEFDSRDMIQDAVAQLNGDLLLNAMYSSN